MKLKYLEGKCAADVYLSIIIIIIVVIIILNIPHKIHQNRQANLHIESSKNKPTIK